MNKIRVDGPLLKEAIGRDINNGELVIQQTMGESHTIGDPKGQRP